MVDATRDQLRKQNDRLRNLVVQLSSIILNVAEQQVGPKPHSETSLSSGSLAPVDIAPRLRDLAMFYTRLSRENDDSGAAEKLEGLSAELADAAERVAAFFSIRGDGGA
jgi:hypothetical protein